MLARSSSSPQDWPSLRSSRVAASPRRRVHGTLRVAHASRPRPCAADRRLRRLSSARIPPGTPCSATQGINFLETDAWYHVRLAENQVRNYPVARRRSIRTRRRAASSCRSRRSSTRSRRPRSLSCCTAATPTTTTGRAHRRVRASDSRLADGHCRVGAGDAAFRSPRRADRGSAAGCAARTLSRSHHARLRRPSRARSAAGDGDDCCALVALGVGDSVALPRGPGVGRRRSVSTCWRGGAAPSSSPFSPRGWCCSCRLARDLRRSCRALRRHTGIAALVALVLVVALFRIRACTATGARSSRSPGWPGWRWRVAREHALERRHPGKGEWCFAAVAVVAVRRRGERAS